VGHLPQAHREQLPLPPRGRRHPARHAQRRVRVAATGARGIFLLYEPTRRDDEDRAAFLDRFLRTNKPLWKALTPSEWDQNWQHVTTCDFPETAALWCELGRKAGFAQARQSSSIRPTSSACSASSSAPRRRERRRRPWGGTEDRTHGVRSVV
jgi:hypothetical protein